MKQQSLNAVTRSALVLALFAAISLGEAAFAAPTVDVVVREAPYVVSTVSSKSEKAWAKCRYCGSKTSYEKKFKWDVYEHVWVETTRPESIPDVCRKCKAKDRDREDLDNEERDLDRRIDKEQTRQRIDKKKKKLRSLREKNR